MSRTSRRDFLALGSLSAAALAAARSAPAQESAPKEAAADAHQATQPSFRYCLNTATIRGQNLGIVEEIRIAAQAGYTGIEPWINEIEQYQRDGGTLADLAKRIKDAGLTVESAIGFAAFLSEDPQERQKGLEEARRCMDLVKQIGGSRIAAPPVGVTDRGGLDLLALGERFRSLVELGREMEVLPQLELWGFSKTLSRLGEVAFVAVESGHPQALCLLDVYHIYKGGSDFGGLGIFSGARMECFHMNDYPADPVRGTIKDEHRVYPGDGVAPLGSILTTLHRSGFRGALSLELFNRDYWKQDAFEVARTGLEKMKAAVAAAFPPA